MPKYLDETGLARFSGNIKQQLVRSFDTVADMQAATDLKVGMTCHTNGYTSASDGRESYYTIAASGTIACANSLYATEVKDNDTLAVNPDDFTGTDSQKLAAAMTAAIANNHSTIIITRLYTLTEDFLIQHRGNTVSADSPDLVNARLNIIGLGPNCGFDCGQYSIAAPSGASYGMCSFKNLRFTGTGNLIESDYLIRCTFDNCVFAGGVNVVNVVRYAQSYVFVNCTFRQWTGSVFKDSVGNCTLSDVQLIGCLIEYGNHVIDMSAAYGVTFNQCCIEGLTGAAFVISGDTRSFNVVHCYFEGNNYGELVDNAYTQDGCIFDLTGLVGAIQEIDISHNRFATYEGAQLIKLPNIVMTSSNITIFNNWTSAGAILVVPHASMTSMYPGVHVGGSPSATYIDKNKLKISDYSDLSNVTLLSNSAALSTLTNTGLYYSTSSQAIPDAPTTGIFYMLHIQRSPTVYFQVAASRNGMWFRYAGYNWQQVTSSDTGA